MSLYHYFKNCFLYKATSKTNQSLLAGSTVGKWTNITVNNCKPEETYCPLKKGKNSRIGVIFQTSKYTTPSWEKNSQNTPFCSKTVPICDCQSLGYNRWCCHSIPATKCRWLHVWRSMPRSRKYTIQLFGNVVCRKVLSNGKDLRRTEKKKSIEIYYSFNSL